MSLLIVSMTVVAVVLSFYYQAKIIRKDLEKQIRQKTEDELIRWWANDNRNFEVWATRRHVELLDQDITLMKEVLGNEGL